MTKDAAKHNTPPPQVEAALKKIGQIDVLMQSIAYSYRGFAALFDIPVLSNRTFSPNQIVGISAIFQNMATSLEAQADDILAAIDDIVDFFAVNGKVYNYQNK